MDSGPPLHPWCPKDTSATLVGCRLSWDAIGSAVVSRVQLLGLLGHVGKKWLFYFWFGIWRKHIKDQKNKNNPQGGLAWAFVKKLKTIFHNGIIKKNVNINRWEAKHSHNYLPPWTTFFLEEYFKVSLLNGHKDRLVSKSGRGDSRRKQNVRYTHTRIHDKPSISADSYPYFLQFELLRLLTRTMLWTQWALNYSFEGIKVDSTNQISLAAFSFCRQ
jgi:hypothetical protein